MEQLEECTTLGLEEWEHGVGACSASMEWEHMQCEQLKLPTVTNRNAVLVQELVE